MWIPEVLGHGFVVAGESAEVLYKTTDYGAPEYERAGRWDDPAIGIDWPLQGAPLLSEKDQAAVLLANAETFP